MDINPAEPVISHKDPRHHVTPMRMYYIIFFALMVLTAVTVGIAFVNLGPLNAPVALLIATTKATIVILYFMHVRYSTRLTWVVVIGSFLWLGVLFVLTLSDYLSRGYLNRVFDIPKAHF